MNPRLRRLQSDYDLVREVFSGHPHVSVEPIGTRLPPESYRVEFRLRGLYLNGDQPDYRDVHRAEIMLPRRYPAEKPYVVPVAPIFHPNIQEFFCIADYWAAGTTLADVIAKLGDMIQWRIYNCASPLDALAASWAMEHESTGLFPIGEVDLGVPDFDVEVRAKDAPQPAPVVVGGAGAAKQGGGTGAAKQGGGTGAAKQDGRASAAKQALEALKPSPAAEDGELVVLLRGSEPERDGWL
jgi:ubiquitin-protein ligase